MSRAIALIASFAAVLVVSCVIVAAAFYSASFTKITTPSVTPNGKEIVKRGTWTETLRSTSLMLVRVTLSSSGKCLPVQ